MSKTLCRMPLVKALSTEMKPQRLFFKKYLVFYWSKALILKISHGRRPPWDFSVP